jgi:hypothetical protein
LEKIYLNVIINILKEWLTKMKTLTFCTNACTWLRYMIHTRCIQLNPENYHVSHLCHSKTCVNILHLSLEPPHVNNSRLQCTCLESTISSKRLPVSTFKDAVHLSPNDDYYLVTDYEGNIGNMHFLHPIPEPQVTKPELLQELILTLKWFYRVFGF